MSKQSMSMANSFLGCSLDKSTSEIVRGVDLQSRKIEKNLFTPYSSKISIHIFHQSIYAISNKMEVLKCQTIPSFKLFKKCSGTRVSISLSFLRSKKNISLSFCISSSSAVTIKLTNFNYFWCSQIWLHNVLFLNTPRLKLQGLFCFPRTSLWQTITLVIHIFCGTKLMPFVFC